MTVRCLVRRCTALCDTGNPPPDWTRDRIGRLSCPTHPDQISCRICGDPRAPRSLFCAACSADENQAGTRYDVQINEPISDAVAARIRQRLASEGAPVRRVNSREKVDD